mgnify:CR=1 FL=1|tara:strand:+ start:245 stop:769 length:525 start_codon:yes stop_codon:yes gene_type:complete
MPLAVTHVLLTIILVDLYRDYVMKNHKKLLSMHTLLIAGIAGLLPDIDIMINGFLTIFNMGTALLQHGGITHTPLFGLIFLIPGFILWKQNKHKLATICFVITFGILFHIFLDFILGGGAHTGIMLFWPISTATFKLHILRQLGMANLPMAIDAIILLVWLWHEEAKHKIKDFI